MSKFKGTEGDWEYVFADNEFEVFSDPIYTGDFKDICNNIKNEYDALLISKAPEMLEMLKKVLAINLAHNFNRHLINEQIERLIKEATEL